MPRLDEGAILIETRKLPSHLPRGIGRHLDPGGADRPALPRGEPGRHQDRAAGRGHRGHGHLPGRRLRQPPPDGRVEERLVEGGADRPHGGGARRDAGSRPTTSPSPWPCASTRWSPASRPTSRSRSSGPTPRLLEQVGDEIRAVLDKVRGAADLQVEVLSGAAQVQIDIDRPDGPVRPERLGRARARRDGHRRAATATEILDGPRRFDVVVRFPERCAATRSALASSSSPPPAARRCRSRASPTSAPCQGPEAINHEGGQRRLVVQTNVRGRDVGSFVAEAQQKMASAVKLPAGLLR